MLTWARLSFRLQRLEILLIGAAVLVASGLMLWWAYELDGIVTAYPDCDYFDPAFACRAAGQRFGETFSTAEVIIRNTWVAGFAVGLVLGVPLVAREIDHGTAQLAWTLSRSRTRWLLGRVTFGALVALLLGALLAVTTEVLATAMLPDINMSQDFHFHGNRGPVIVGRAMLGLGAGVLVGALLGRQLPALLLGLIVIGLLYGAVTFAFGRWNESEAIEAWYDQDLGAPLFVGSGVRLASGERLSMGEFYGGGNEAFQGDDGQLYASADDVEAERDPIGQEYILVIPGERYPEIVARETAVFTGAGLLLVGGAAAVIRRRRPS